MAWAFYRFIKILEYEMANPGQDKASEEEAAREAESAESKRQGTPRKETV